MATLTIGRMAKLYRMHRSSLYQAVDEGRISAGLDGRGQKVIDLSEMLRVYGEPAGLPDTNPTASGSPPDSPTVLPVSRINALLEAVQKLTEEVEQLRAELAEHRLLTHQPAQKVPATKPKPPAQSFGDLLAGMDD